MPTAVIAPTDQDCPASSVLRDILRQRKNPAANHRTHHQRDQGIEPKLLRLLRHRHLVIGSANCFRYTHEYQATDVH
jgi:hypothetical protein